MGSMEIDLESKSALVTGSTGGIGREIAIELATEGADVVVNGRSKDKGEEVVEIIEETGAKGSFEQANINDYEEVEDMVHNSIDTMGSIDILVVSGVASAGPVPNFFHDTEPEKFMEFCKVGYVNRLYCIKAILDHLIETGGGRIINITADAGKVATPAEVGPGGSAAALMMATRVMANEFSRWEINVNAISLSVTKDTPAYSWGMEQSPAAHVFENAVEKQTFSVSPSDVAETVVFLAGSKSARPITGQIISVNGGTSFPG